MYDYKEIYRVMGSISKDRKKEDEDEDAHKIGRNFNSLKKAIVKLEPIYS